MSLVPQSIEPCDICGKLRVEPSTRQTIILCHGNQWPGTDTFGPTDSFNQMTDNEWDVF